MPLGRHVVHYRALGSRVHPRHLIGSTPRVRHGRGRPGALEAEGATISGVFPPKTQLTKGPSAYGSMGLWVPSFLHLGRVPASCRELALCHVTSVTLASDSPPPPLAVLNTASHPGFLVPAQTPGTTLDMNTTVSFGLILFPHSCCLCPEQGWMHHQSAVICQMIGDRLSYKPTTSHHFNLSFFIFSYHSPACDPWAWVGSQNAPRCHHLLFAAPFLSSSPSTFLAQVIMASFKDHVLIAFVLLARYAMATPIPKTFSQDIGQLSFSELAQQTLRRILDLGFTRGILSSLLIIGCLVCILICVLCVLAAYVERCDPDGACCQRQSRAEDHISPAHEKALQSPNQLDSFSSPKDHRIYRYSLSSPSSPLTKITIHTSSVRQTKSAKTSSIPSAPEMTRSAPLRSALSRSPTRFQHAQSLLFGTRRRQSPSNSAKSVRWADEIQISIIARVDISFDREAACGARTECDVGTVSIDEADPYALSDTQSCLDGQREVIKS